ncbi:hypothetical protein BBF93_01930 [Hyphomonas sp. CACIAM 19H1]|uniref:hypothetical protein n=1 Tax=Hyphomonas sp. CACIAM 19H1 TaxID=1873716 RepID=UPI000DF078DB|nr:hypothetical protein [Hyphomonas sp. CACIAM 19H1]AXE63105.1 hypothetical protein BBF93_01930 [Hyphomonas sp. CACIAM 19H1]
MAKALFHKSQRVYVKPVGTWVPIERVVPHWVKGVDEPLRITYDCGLGRLFQAHELVSEEAMHRQERSEEDDEDDTLIEQWRVVRRLMKWRSGDGQVALGVTPGTYPAVATDDGPNSGWRVPATEYDRDPARVEHQARMIAHTPDLFRVARKIAEFAGANPKNVPEELRPVAARCAKILRAVYRLEEDTAATAAE